MATGAAGAGAGAGDGAVNVETGAGLSSLERSVIALSTDLRVRLGTTGAAAVAECADCTFAA
jgi:hypothetical protein